MNDKKSFLGTGWGFPPTFKKGSASVGMVADVEDIHQSLQILLTTRIGERIMRPGYGCNTERLLFEPLNTSLQTYMQDLVKRAILRYEPRIKLDKVSLEPTPLEGRILLKVDYTVKGTNSRYNFVYPFYLEEGSGIDL